jgi:hypothetical protein
MELDPLIEIQPAHLVRSIRYDRWKHGKHILELNPTLHTIKVGEHFGWLNHEDHWEFWILRDKHNNYIQRVIHNHLIVLQKKL